MKKIILQFVFVFIAQTIFATHNRGGEIYYKRVAPFTALVNNVTVPVYNYSITVIRYTEDGLNFADRCDDTLYFGDGSKSLISRSNGNGTCSCQSFISNAKCGEIIVNLPGYIVKKNVYSTTHTYPGMGNYVIRSTDVNRNAGILNIPNSINIPMCMEALLVISATSGINSSPILNNAPTDMATNVNCFYHQPNATDADGDSLSYELIPCKGSNGASIVGYTYPTFNTGGYFYLGSNGLISWCRPVSIGEYNIAFYVKEWRKNTSGVFEMIGLIERDMQIIVKAGVLSIENQKTDLSSINTYPVPFNEKLTVELNSDSKSNHSIKLFNLTGQLVYESGLIGNKVSFNTEHLAKGIYILEIKNGKENIYKKLIKE